MKRLGVVLFLLLVVALFLGLGGSALAADMGAIGLGDPKVGTLVSEPPGDDCAEHKYMLTLDGPCQVAFDLIMDAPGMGLTVKNTLSENTVFTDYPDGDRAYPFKHSASRPLSEGVYTVTVFTDRANDAHADSYRLTLRRTAAYAFTEREPNGDFTTATGNPLRMGKNTGMYTVDDGWDIYPLRLTGPKKIRFTLKMKLNDGYLAVYDRDADREVFAKWAHSGANKPPKSKTISGTIILKPANYYVMVYGASRTPATPGKYTLTAAAQRMPATILTLPKSITMGVGGAMGPNNVRQLPAGIAPTTYIETNLAWSISPAGSAVAEVDAGGNVVAKAKGTAKLVLTDSLSGKSVSTKLVVADNVFRRAKPYAQKGKGVYLSLKSLKFNAAGGLTGQIYVVNKIGRTISGYSGFHLWLHYDNSAYTVGGTNVPAGTFAAQIKKGKVGLIDFTIPKAAILDGGAGLDLKGCTWDIRIDSSMIFYVPVGSVKGKALRGNMPGVAELEGARPVMQPGQRAR